MTTARSRIQSRTVKTLSNKRCVVTRVHKEQPEREWRERTLALIEEMGDSTPSIMALAEMQNIPYATARARLRALRRDGLLDRRLAEER